jgi:hypothetical protein
MIKNLRLNKYLIINFFIYIFINSLFLFKYTTRIDFLSPEIFFVSYIFFITVFFLLCKFINVRSNFQKVLLVFLLVFTGIFIVFIQNKINPVDINVDRWSAINNFILNLLHGISPYSAQTHLGGYGSPFPVWQIFHIPFFLLGDIALAMVFCFLCFIITIKWFTDSNKVALSSLFMLTLSPAFWYEVLVRSDLMYNFLCVLIALLIIRKLNINIQSNTVRLGIICGLFLSTRLSIFIPFALYFFYEFKSINFKKQIIFLFIILLVFLLTFLPFAIWDFKTLFLSRHNPFVLQTSQSSGSEIIIVLFLVIYFSLRAKSNFNLTVSYISITFFILVGLTFLIRAFDNKFIWSIFSSAYDISYFNMALPFTIFSLSLFYYQKTENNNSLN